jgi:hypothetical protein
MNTPSQPPLAPRRKAASGLNMEIVIALLVALVAVAAIITSRGFPGTGLSTDIGSGRFPLIYSIALLALSATLIIQNVLKARETTAPSADDESPRPNYLKSFAGIVASLLCLGALPYAGYLLVTAIYLSYLMWLLGMKRKVLNPLLAIVIAGVLYFTFSSGLHVPLPDGSLFE